MASSALSIAFYWSVLASKFVYGKSFSGKAGIWIQANLVLVLAGILVLIPSLTQTSLSFNYQYRPHELYSNRTEAEFWYCDRLRRCCFAQPFNVSDIQWVTANCDLAIQHEAIVELVFRDLKQIRSHIDVSHNLMLQEVNFPVLSSSSSRLEIANNSGLTSLGLPMLERIYYLYVADNPKLQEVDLPVLQSSLNLEITNNSVLTYLGFPMLKDIYNEIAVSNNAMLQEVIFPKLSYSGDLEITYNSVLTFLGFPMLETAGSFYVVGNSMLQVVNFPVLQGFYYSNSRIEITNNSVLTSLGFPELERAGVVVVANNTALTSLVCDKLYSMTSATISNNPALQVVHFPSLPSSNACRVVGFEGTVVFSDREVTYPVGDCA